MGYPYPNFCLCAFLGPYVNASTLRVIWKPDYLPMLFPTFPCCNHNTIKEPQTLFKSLRPLH